VAGLRSRLIYWVHALQRMQERDISDDEVRKVLSEGREIETYPADHPYPSRLILGWSGPRPIHIVAAANLADNETLIVTVYEPDPNQWEPGFERRKS
jgi:hypothetical protein